MSYAASSTVPTWFTRAISARPEHHRVPVDGAGIHFRTWGDVGAPGVVLIHGGGANGAWWDHIGPLMATTLRATTLMATTMHVVAADLSGHGDSDHRRTYSMASWAAEVRSAAAAAGMVGEMAVVGHSMGGCVAAELAVRDPRLVRRLILVDSPLPEADPEVPRDRPARIFASAEEIRGRFALVPRQEVMLPYVAEHVAAHSIREVPGGWAWKADSQRMNKRSDHPFRLADALCRSRTEVVLLRCQHGLVTDSMADTIGAIIAGRGAIVDLPECGHHPMMDRPHELTIALRDAVDRPVIG